MSSKFLDSVNTDDYLDNPFMIINDFCQYYNCVSAITFRPNATVKLEVWYGDKHSYNAYHILQVDTLENMIYGLDYIYQETIADIWNQSPLN